MASVQVESASSQTSPRNGQNQGTRNGLTTRGYGSRSYFMNGGNVDPIYQNMEQIQSKPMILPEVDYECTSYQIALDLFKFHFDECGLDWPLNIEPLATPPDKTMKTMRRLHVEYNKQYRDVYPIHSLQAHGLFISSTRTYPLFMAVMDELFRDGRVNFGRLVAVYSFGTTLAAECLEQNHPHLVKWVVDWTASYAEHVLGQWLREHGGWDGFVEFFNKHERSFLSKMASNFSWKDVSDTACKIVFS